jgi:hypothetical protein
MQREPATPESAGSIEGLKQPFKRLVLWGMAETLGLAMSMYNILIIN